MVAARTFAMAFNRIVDRELDARNPRTASRELVTGAVAVRTAVVGSGRRAAGVPGRGGLLSPLCLALAPIALALLALYPYGKRFTWLCHGILGLAQAVGPIGAWIAVTGHWSWCAGAARARRRALDRRLRPDLRAAGPRLRPGRRRLLAARALRCRSSRCASRGAAHVVTLALFVAYGIGIGAGVLWFVGVAAWRVAFGYEHSIVSPNDLSRVNRAFFTTNGFVGIALFVFGLADLLARGLGA